MLNIAICDDERFFADKISDIVREYLDSNNMTYDVDLFESGDYFLAKEFELSKYDIVFLDINMDGMDGIQTATKLREYCPDTFIVFVTGFINYTLDGYKVEAIRYILKDFESMGDNIREALDAIRDKLDLKSDVLELNFLEGDHKIKFSNILYIENNLHKLFIHTIEDKKVHTYSIYMRMDEIGNLLNTKYFLRNHQSYIVNLQYVMNIERYQFTLKNHLNIPIAKQRYMEAKQAYVKYRGAL